MLKGASSKTAFSSAQVCGEGWKEETSGLTPPHGGMTPASLFKSRVQRIENDVEGAHKESSSEQMNGEEFVSCSSFISSFSFANMHVKRSCTDATLQIIPVRGAGNFFLNPCLKLKNKLKSLQK